MRNRLLILVILTMTVTGLHAQKDSCMVGICINNLYDFKVDDKSYMADFWTWVKSSYPGITAEITIKKNNSWVKLVKMLTGVYVAFLISCIVFFVSSENQDSRFGLCVGGIFAAIGNKYIVESIVPSSTSNTLMDDVHTLTFILFCSSSSLPFR